VNSQKELFGTKTFGMTGLLDTEKTFYQSTNAMTKKNIAEVVEGALGREVVCQAPQSYPLLYWSLLRL